MRQIMWQLKQISLFPRPSMVVIGENASIAQKALNCLIHPEMEEKIFYHYCPWYYPSHGKKHYFASVPHSSTTLLPADDLAKWTGLASS